MEHTRTDNLAWKNDAACRGVINPDMFFHESSDPRNRSKAMAICAACPVRQFCLAFAIENGEGYGIWGGLDFTGLTKDQSRTVAPTACPAPSTGHWNLLGGTCVRGHEYTKENVGTRPDGRRYCRKCARVRANLRRVMAASAPSDDTVRCTPGVRT